MPTSRAPSPATPRPRSRHDGRRRALTALAALLLALVGVTATGGAAIASDACTAGHNASGQSVWYCGVWVPSGGVPVYSSTSSGATVVDHLHTGGTANWFFCSTSGGTASAGGYSSSSWARTIGDDHSAQGWVPAVYFAGAESYWNGLPGCGDGGSAGGTGCTAGYTSGGTAVHYCGVWLPSGGVPIYASTSTGSAVVDHLLRGGTTNWFTCQVDGGTASAGGYSSSNWARTVGDQNGSTGYVPAVYFAGSQSYWPGLPSCGDSTPPPTPENTACESGHNASGVAVGYCPVWVPSGGVPVYASTSTASVVDHLHTGGSANWFYCRTGGSTASAAGYSSSDWAKTVGDDNGATGWVPAIYFSGAESYWAGLSPCASGGGNPSPPPVSGGTTSSGSLTCHGVAVPYASLPARTITLLQKACGLTGTYSWGGGHLGTPGPSYGHYDGQDPASLHDDQVLGLDCSGFVRYAYYLTTGDDALDGVTWQQWNEANAMPHAAVVMGGMGSVSAVAGSLRVGDILWYGQNADEHVAIYLGDGRQVNAYESGQPYGVTSTDSSGFWGAVRLW